MATTDHENASFFLMHRDEVGEPGRFASKAYAWFSDAHECAAVGLTVRARQSRRNGQRWARKFHAWRRAWKARGIGC